MENLWNNVDAAADPSELGQRVYSSRLLGRDPALVLHGGGNTSVKIRQPDLFGRDEDILYVKGSGRDLDSIDASGFAPLRIAPLLQLATLPALSDTRMANELRCALIDASAPNPSVETILHALIPHRYVDHTHADAVLTITHTVDGAERIRDAYGDNVAILPYVMPGFLLARQVYEALPTLNIKHISGIVLLNHGIFTFGATARESYDRMIALVSQAEDYLKQRQAWSLPSLPQHAAQVKMAVLRQNISALAGAPVLVHFWSVSCHICHENMPALARWRQEFVPAGVRFMSVHLPRQESDLDVDAVRARVAEFAISEPCAVDNARAIADAFQNRVVPAYYLFDREGALRARTAGPAGLAMFEAALRRQTSRN